MKYLIIILLLAACQVKDPQPVILKAGIISTDTIPKDTSYKFPWVKDPKWYITSRGITQDEARRISENDSLTFWPTGQAISSPLGYLVVGEEYGRNKKDRWVYYIAHGDKYITEQQRIAEGILTHDTFTLSKKWPQVRQTPRVIKAFGKTYTITD